MTNPARYTTERISAVRSRPTVAIADTTESRNHPTASSNIPAVSVSWPTSRCSRFMSANVLAMTGIAVTHIATPMNVPNTTRLWWGISELGA